MIFQKFKDVGSIKEYAVKYREDTLAVNCINIIKHNKLFQLFDPNLWFNY